MTLTLIIKTVFGTNKMRSALSAKTVVQHLTNKNNVIVPVIQVGSFHSSPRTNLKQNHSLIYRKQYNRKWIKNDHWNKLPDGSFWAPNIPTDIVEDPWNEDNALFGAYDYIDILGNDLNLHPKMFCEGPSYVRGEPYVDELRMLLRKRKELGSKLFIEDMSAIDKRIKWLTIKITRRKLDTYKLMHEDIMEYVDI